MGVYYWIVAPESRRCIDVNKSDELCAVTGEIATSDLRERIDDEWRWSDDQKERLHEWLDEYADDTVRVWHDAWDLYRLHLLGGNFVVDDLYRPDYHHQLGHSQAKEWLRSELRLEGVDKPYIDIDGLGEDDE